MLNKTEEIPEYWHINRFEQKDPHLKTFRSEEARKEALDKHHSKPNKGKNGWSIRSNKTY